MKSKSNRIESSWLVESTEIRFRLSTFDFPSLSKSLPYEKKRESDITMDLLTNFYLSIFFLFLLLPSFLPSFLTQSLCDPVRSSRHVTSRHVTFSTPIERCKHLHTDRTNHQCIYYFYLLILEVGIELVQKH